ncbi:undecaprenyl-phosphate glucose phosphotransferase [Bacteroidota bacterium]
MNSKTSKLELIIPIATILTDSLSIILAFLISYWIRFFSSIDLIFPVVRGYPPLTGYLFFGIVTIPLWIITFHAHKMYRLNRVTFIFDEFFIILKCVTISILFSIGVIFFFREFPYSRLVFIFIWITSTMLITIGRYILLKIEKDLYNKNIGVKNVAVLGTNDMADKIYRKFTVDKFAGFNIVGYFATEKIENENKIYLGNYDSIPHIVKQEEIEKILLSLSSSEHDDLYDIMKKCEGVNVEFMLVPDFLGLLTSRLKVDEVDGIPFMKLKYHPMNIWNKMLKRSFDILLSIIFLIVLSPIILLLSILIKITSKGDLFYKQERVGLDGIKFVMYKFRSMILNAEPSGPQFTTTDDSRYTSVGKYLRKYSLDEIPQFINVIKGEMSIVGPRPEREYFIDQMKDSVRRYLERHRVKCGITGWAQVNGLRGSSTPMQTRIDYDIYYIENWSLIFDIKIIIKTLKEMFFSKKAF